MHSHSYRHPQPFSGQSVVVLGAGASGLDIALELASVDAQVITVLSLILSTLFNND